MTQANAQELTQDQLDNMVHAMKSREASNINNEGREAQLAYLEETGAIVPVRAKDRARPHLQGVIPLLLAMLP